MAKYQQYEEYRNTHNQWLTEIPNHWSLVALKHILSVPMTDGPHETPGFVDEGVPFVSAEAVSSGKIDFKKIRGFITEVDDKRFSQKYKPQLYDVYMIKSGATTGVTAIVETEYDFNIWSPLAAMRCKKSYDPFFLLNYLRSSPFQKSVQLSWTFGTQQNIGMSTLENLPICVPPKLEQKKIADFLNYETAQIDTLIEKQQTLIQLLKEKRQAVISHAVTKGLNHEAPMKESGVEWLGEVPQHWEQVKLKHIVDSIIDAEHKTAPYFEQGKYLVCRTTNVRNGELRLEGGKYTNEETYLEWIKRGRPEIGDILFTREAPAGEACVYDGAVPLCLGQRMVLFKLKKDRVLPTFVLHSIYSGLADDFIKQLSQGSTVAHFNMADIRNIPLFEPSLVEQQEIVEYLSKLLNKFDDLVYSAEKAIQLMQERRTALISAAVTGKIDVRGWVESE